MIRESSFQKSASRVLILSGVVAVPVGLLTLIYPPSIDNTVWGYPFHHGTHVVVSIFLVIAHLLKAYGFIGLSRLNGAGSMLLAIPSMIGGITIIRRRLLDGFGRWSVFLSGAFMVFVVTPLLFMGRAWPAYLALIGWSLFYIWIGLAMGRTARS